MGGRTRATQRACHRYCPDAGALRRAQAALDRCARTRGLDGRAGPGVQGISSGSPLWLLGGRGPDNTQPAGVPGTCKPHASGPIPCGMILVPVGLATSSPRPRRSETRVHGENYGAAAAVVHEPLREHLELTRFLPEERPGLGLPVEILKVFGHCGQGLSAARTEGGRARISSWTRLRALSGSPSP